MASVSNNEGKRLCQWIGNSQLIAQENYLMTNDAHFAKAACEPVKADRNALRNALQSMAESDRTRLQAQNSDSEKSLVLPLCVDICSYMHDMPLLGTGTEQPVKTRRTRRFQNPPQQNPQHFNQVPIWP